jgi:hypothetical protein
MRSGDTESVSLKVSGGFITGFKWVAYTCGLCNKKYLIVLYRESGHEQRTLKYEHNSLPPGQVTVITKIQKIGQYPAASLNIPKGLEKNLGAEAVSLYKKALINRNEGFGLGAVTYIRRVVEDKTNELIEVAAQSAESSGVNATIVEQIRAVATKRATYDEKLKLAATVFPESLRIEGINPLQELYGLVSEAIHGLSEEDCIKAADATTKAFEYIFTNLRAQTDERHDYVATMKKLAKRNSPAKTS